MWLSIGKQNFVQLNQLCSEDRINPYQLANLPLYKGVRGFGLGWTQLLQQEQYNLQHIHHS